MAEQTPEQVALGEALAPWFDTWVPCELGEHDRLQTTTELLGMVQRFTYALHEPADLVQLLRHRGFRHAFVADELRWLLKERQA